MITCSRCSNSAILIVTLQSTAGVAYFFLAGIFPVPCLPLTFPTKHVRVSIVGGITIFAGFLPNKPSMVAC